MLSMKETYKMAYLLTCLLYAVSVIVQHDAFYNFVKVVNHIICDNHLSYFKILKPDISESL